MSYVAPDMEAPFRPMGTEPSDSSLKPNEVKRASSGDVLSSFAVQETENSMPSSFGVQLCTREVHSDLPQMSQEEEDLEEVCEWRTDSALLMETVVGPDELDNSTQPEGSSAVASEALSPKKKKAERIYYLDWLRIMAIYLVVFYHCIQGLDWVNLWPGDEKLHVIAYKSSSLQVGMPIFFHISGRAQALAKPTKMRATVASRFQRLLIPFFVGYFLLIPFWQYCQWRDRTVDEWGEQYADMPKWFFLWIFWFFQPGHYAFEVGWLWFLPALFVCGVFNAPLFLYAERRELKYGLISAGCWIGITGLLCILGIPLWLMVFSALAPLCLCIIVVAVPFPPRGEASSWSATRWLAVQGSTFIQIVCMMGMVCSFSYPELGGAKMVPAFLLFFGFYSHGYFVQRWAVGRADAECESVRSPEDRVWKRKLKLGTGIWQIVTVCMMVLSIAIGAPVGQWEEELFPIYSASFNGSPFFAVAHIAGTWAMIGLVVAWFQAYANREINREVYKHATSSVIVVYIFHWVFIAPFSYWVCRDFDMMSGGWKLIDPLLTLVVACGGPYLIYILLLRYPKAGVLFGL